MDSASASPKKKNKNKIFLDLKNFVFDNNEKRLKKKFKTYLKNKDRFKRYSKSVDDLFEDWKNNNLSDKETIRLARGVLKTNYPKGIQSQVKSNLLYRDSYEFNDNPYEIPVSDYINIIKQYKQNTENLLKHPCPKTRSSRRKLFDSLVLLTIAGVILLGFGYLIWMVQDLYRNEKDGSRNKNLLANTDDVEDTVVEDRLEIRQTVASLFATATFSLMNAYADGVAGIDAATSTILIGMIMGNTIGFVFDQVIASEEALQFRYGDYDENETSTKRNFTLSMRFAFGGLYSSKFARFFLTVIIDAFVSLVFFKVLYPKIYKFPGVRCLNDSNARTLSNFLTTFLISISTFLLYAQKLRSNWAYPPIRLKSNDFKISNDTVLIFVTIAAALFSVTNTQMIPNESVFSVNNPRTKTIFTVIGLGLAVILAKQGFIDSKQEFERKEEFRVLTATFDGNVKLNDHVTLDDGRDAVVLRKVGEGNEYKVGVVVQLYKDNAEDIYTKEETTKYAWGGFALYLLIALLTTSITILGTSKLPRRSKIIFWIVFFLVTMLPAYLIF